MTYMIIRKLMIAALVLSAAIFSCKKKEKCEDSIITKEKLQGRWKEKFNKIWYVCFPFSTGVSVDEI